MNDLSVPKGEEARVEITCETFKEIANVVLDDLHQQQTLSYKLKNSWLGKLVHTGIVAPVSYYSGIAISYTKEQVEAAKSLSELSFIFRELWYVPRKYLVYTAFFAVLEAALYALGPFLLKTLIDSASKALAAPGGTIQWAPWLPSFSTQSVVDIVIFSFVVVLISRFASFNIQTFFGKNTSATVGNNISKRVAEKILRADMATHNYLKTGSTLNKFSRSIGYVENYLYSTSVQGLLANFFAIPFIIILMFMDNVYIALIAAVPLVLLIIINIYFGSTLSKNQSKLNKMQSDMGQRLYRVVSCIREVIVANERENEINAVLEEQEAMLPLKIQQSKIWRYLTTALNFLENLFLGVIFWWITRLIYDQHVTVGAIAQYYAWYTLLYAKFMDVQFKYSNSLQQVATVREIKGLDSFRPSVAEGSRELDPETARGDIEFKNVVASYQTVGYDGRPGKTVQALKGVSFTIRSGHFNVIVGPTGSGKSTVINLIARLYDPVDGSINLNGININEFTLSSYRHNLAVLTQKPALFDVSIRDNIVYGANWATEDEIWEATRQSQIFDYIKDEAPDGLDTILGQRGTTLSGGQVQRVALARAVLRSQTGNIVLMDEPTSDLDRRTAIMFLRDARKVFSSKTVIMVTHLIIEDADNIIVVDHGKVVGTGTHEELMQSNEIYYDLASGVIRTK